MRADNEPNSPYDSPHRPFRGWGCLSTSLGALGLVAAGTFLGTKITRFENDSEKRDERYAQRELMSIYSSLQEIALTPEEGLALIAERGKLLPKVEELFDQGSGNYSYILFFAHAPEDSSKPLRIVRDFSSPQARSQFVAALRSNGFTIQASERPPNEVAPPLDIGALIKDAGLGVLYLSLAMLTLKVLRDGVPDVFSLGRRSKIELWKRGSQSAFETFKDIGGCPQIIEELTELVQDVRLFRHGDMPIHLPRGVLFEGGPGVGKTLSARAVAGELDAPFLYVNSGSLVSSSFMGAWTREVLDLFKAGRRARDAETVRLRALPGATGKERGVAIIFLDEIDTIGTARPDEASPGGINEDVHAVNALLAEMDGVNQEHNEGIILIAATNRKHALDTALLRPGRFSKIINIPLPISSEQRRDIIARLARRHLGELEMSFEDDAAAAYLARITPGKSGDHIRGILIEAASLSRRNGHRVISTADISEAFQRIEIGRRTDLVSTPAKYRLVVYHEVAHGLLGLLCGWDPFVISMKPRGDTLGRVLLDPQVYSEPPSTRDDLLRHMLVYAAGRAGELCGGGAGSATTGTEADFDALRRLGLSMLDSSMLGDHFGVPVNSTPVGELPERYQLALEQVCANAVRVSFSILSMLGEDRLRALVDEIAALDTEIIGPQAKALLSAHLPADIRIEMERALEQYLREPLSPASDNIRGANSKNTVATEEKTGDPADR